MAGGEVRPSVVIIWRLLGQYLVNTVLVRCNQERTRKITQTKNVSLEERYDKMSVSFFPIVIMA